MRRSASLIALMLAGCAPAEPASDSAAVQPASVSVPTDAASCRLAGGTMKPAGRLQALRCVLSYADAGRSCTSGDQCAGDCRAPAGVEVAPGQAVAGLCQATSDPFGCSTKVEDGRAQATICID